MLLASCKSNNISKIEIDKLPRDSVFSLAKGLYNKGDYVLSLAYYNRLLSVDSTNGEFFYRRGNCKGQLFDYAGSNNDYKNAIRLGYENLGNVYYNIGLNYFAIENDSLALEYFYLALKENPNDQSIISNIELIKGKLKERGIRCII